jgi:hypothetical protein
MAQQKFSNAFREALWETYGKKCFHCSRELYLFDMRVDHIIPEHLHRGPAARRDAVLAEIGLLPSFNILGSENLAPSCDHCNGRKSGSVLVDGTPRITLTEIRRKLPALEKNLSKQRKARAIEETFIAISRSIDQGKFTALEFARQLNKIAKTYPDMSAAVLESLVDPPTEITKPARVSRKRGNNYTGLKVKIYPDIAKLVLDGLDRGLVTAEKDARHPSRYVVKGLRSLMGRGNADIVFDARGDGIKLIRFAA